MEKSVYMKIQKSLRSLLLCVILMCSLLPLSVFAGGQRKTGGYCNDYKGGMV